MLLLDMNNARNGDSNMTARDKMSAFILKHSGAVVEVAYIGDAISCDGDLKEVAKVAKWFKSLNSKIVAKVEDGGDDYDLAGWGYVNVSMTQVVVEPRLIFSHHVVPGQYILQAHTS